jgi:outer membrane protein
MSLPVLPLPFPSPAGDPAGSRVGRGRARRLRVLRDATLGAVLALTACVHNPPNVDGKPSAPTAPNALWQPPKRAITRDSVPQIPIPPDVASRVQHLTLPDVIDIALLNNPQTRISYSQARAAGATIGAAYGRFLPQVTLAATAVRQGSTSSGTTPITGGVATGGGGGGGSYRSLLQPSASLSWLLFEFGETSSFEFARQAAFSASYTHNFTVQGVVLAVEQAYFNYNSAKAVRDGDRQTVREDSTSLQAAEARHAAGVATLSDVLQARTILSQAQLTLETDEGSVQTTRGSLAVGMGFPANVPYDIAPEPPDVPVQGVATSIDSLVQLAVQSRPDLASFRAQAREAEANVGIVKGQGLPSITLNSSASRTYFGNSALNGNTYSAQLGVSYPIFQGFTNAYDVLQARELAKASAANAELQRDQVVFQVFTSYSNLQTATVRVKSADDLLASAQASHDVEIGKYQQGVGSIIDLITAEAALASARSQQASARWTWYSNLAQLSHDVGVLGIHGETRIPLTADTTTTQPPR